MICLVILIYGIMIKHLKEDKGWISNNCAYVVANVNSGTLFEAAEKMYVSQPSLSIAVRELEKELGFKVLQNE